MKSQLSAMAKSMGRSAMTTGNVSLMKKMDVLYTDGGVEEAIADTSPGEGTDHTGTGASESADDFMQVIHLAENQIKVLSFVHRSLHKVHQTSHQKNLGASFTPPSFEFLQCKFCKILLFYKYMNTVNL